eukprot:TRINITY_DN11434_c0_g1_i1.p1 TRINITY_DN11434_c0_g1~~TRINITY_DN11434_c0_g1_i1.p1  ORF type:complete len:378 (-),score=53.33 TRINITY_DN11434_c0_g1_i1:13-1146(-)
MLHSQISKKNRERETEKVLSALYFNNMGCIHYHIKKYSASSFYLAKALKENEASYRQNNNVGGQRTINMFSRDRKTEILYNQGLQLLLNGNPELAFRCLKEASLFYYRRPKLWLRLAECCVAVNQKQQNMQEKTEQRNDVIQAVVGEGKYRRVILPTAQRKGLQRKSQPASSTPNTNNEITIEYGLTCVRNALFLLSASQSAEYLDVQSLGSHSGSAESPSLRQACLVILSYLSLLSEDPVVALSAANELLAHVHLCSEHQRFLAHIYAAEALCMLNRPAEAVQHLPAPSSGSSGPAATKSNQNFSSEAKSTLYINLAAAYILQDKVAQAQKSLMSAFAYGDVNVSAALLMEAYIELYKGNTSNSLALLRKGHPKNS